MTLRVTLTMMAKSEKARMQWISICLAGTGCLLMTVSVIGLALI
jgi:hypothetical protein